MSAQGGPGLHAGGRTFVGFGFGAIQAGLFLLEAQASGAFGRLVVAEVLPAVVESVRGAGGFIAVNVAFANRIEAVDIGPVEIYDPGCEADRAALVAALAQAHEAATAVPSIAHYESDGPASLHRLLAAGLDRKLEQGGPPLVLYAAENHNHAAEALRAAVASQVSNAAALERVAFCNTVIGKMSGAPDARDSAALAPMTPGASRAFLVESFNRILISPPRLPSGERLERGLSLFIEKGDLLPFEEAKLYVHNALHAMAAYLGAAAGLRSMSQLPSFPAILAQTRRAVLEESGAALVARYAGVDALFSAQGMADYADDLFGRMVNPYLADRIERVARDPQRKLAWEDRLIGAMRAALRSGIRPTRLALGAAAALEQWAPGSAASALLPPLWQRPPHERTEVEMLCTLVREAQTVLHGWRAAGFATADPFAPAGPAAPAAPNTDAIT